MTTYSPNANSRPAGARIDFVILHAVEKQLYHNNRYYDPVSFFLSPKSKVSAHYLIHQDGECTLLVPEDRAAWHAGESEWAGIYDLTSSGKKTLNYRSLGIELVVDSLYFPKYTDLQYKACADLVADIMRRHPVRYVVGHYEIAPGRKIDPKDFDWARLVYDVGLRLTSRTESTGRTGYGEVRT